MTDDAAPIIQCGDTVLISGAALPLMYRACLALVQRRHRDGLAAHPLLQLAVTTLHRAVLALIQRRHRDGLSSHELTELRTALYRACMSAQRRKGAAYHLAESRCNGQGRLANPKTYGRRFATACLRR